MSTAAAAPSIHYRSWSALLVPAIVVVPMLIKLAGVPLNNAWIIFTLPA